MIFSVAFRINQGLRNDIYLHCIYRLHFNAKMVERISRLSPKIERQHSVNNSWSCIMHIWRAVRRLQSRIEVLAAFISKMLSTISLLPPENERQQSVISFCAGALTYTATYCIVLHWNWIFNGQSFQYVLVYHFTTMHAMPHRAYFFVARSSRVNI